MSIPFNNLKPENEQIRSRAMRRINQLLDDSVFIEGKELAKFERNFAEYCGVKYCLGLASGTDALRTALLACNVVAGDEVITTPLTYTATSLAIAHAGARPVFVDIGKDGNINPQKISNAVTGRAKAILAVHMYGNPGDIDKIRKISQKHNLFLIDDCSHAQGATYKGKKIGSLADISCFSFYPTKNLGAWGDAGGITTNSRTLRDNAYLYKNCGEIKRNYSVVTGYNSKLDPVQAIVLDEKLKYLDRWNNNRRKVAAYYRKGLAGLPGIGLVPMIAGSSYYLFPILADNKDLLRKTLELSGIPTGEHYPQPMHLQECFRNLGYKKGDFPVAEKFTERVITLPFYPSLKPSAQQKITRAIKGL